MTLRQIIGYILYIIVFGGLGYWGFTKVKNNLLAILSGIVLLFFAFSGIFILISKIKESKREEIVKQYMLTSSDGMFTMNLAEEDMHGIKAHSVEIVNLGGGEIQKENVKPKKVVDMVILNKMKPESEQLTDKQIDSIVAVHTKLYNNSLRVDSIEVSFDHNNFTYYKITNQWPTGKPEISIYPNHIEFRKKAIAAKTIEMKIPVNGEYRNVVFINNINQIKK